LPGRQTLPERQRFAAGKVLAAADLDGFRWDDSCRFAHGEIHIAKLARSQSAARFS